MCQALEELMEDKLQEREEQGVNLGEKAFAELTAKLLEDKRADDLLVATKDREVREKLYAEYGIKK